MHLGQKISNIQLHFKEVNGRKSRPWKRESLQIYSEAKLSTANSNTEQQMFKVYGNFKTLQNCIWKKTTEMFSRAGR